MGSREAIIANQVGEGLETLPHDTDLPQYQRQEVEELRDRLKYFRPEAGGEVVGTAIDGTCNRLTQGAIACVGLSFQ